jgi:hypothetical protein
VTVSAFWGPLVTAVDVDVAVLRTLRAWLPHYLTQAEVERGMTVGAVARPKQESYANTISDDEWPEHRMPAIVITTSRAEGYEMAGDGMYSVGWRCRIAAIARGATPGEARAVAALFGACVKRVLVQQGSLLGAANGVRPVLSDLVAVEDTNTPDEERYLAAALEDMIVFVDQVVQAGVGPFDPPDPDDEIYPPPDPDDPNTPYDPFTTVGDVNVAVVEKENP